MVFGHKCKMCGKDANTHIRESSGGYNVTLDYWLCSKCKSIISDFKYVVYEMEKSEMVTPL